MKKLIAAFAAIIIGALSLTACSEATGPDIKSGVVTQVWVPVDIGPWSNSTYALDIRDNAGVVKTWECRNSQDCRGMKIGTSVAFEIAYGNQITNVKSTGIPTPSPSPR